MDKRLFEYCQKHLRCANSGRFKVTASLKKLVNHYQVGYIDNGFFYFNTQDKQRLIEIVASELNAIHLFRDSYPQEQTRTQVASERRNEKSGALKVSEDFILINSLDSLRLNQQVTQNPQLSSLGISVCASEIKTIEHQQLVLVENLIVMANLAKLNIPESLKGALWLYRGDIKKHQQTGGAYQFFRSFKGRNELICFADLDPSGLQISLTSGAEQWLTVVDEKTLNIKLYGVEQEWFNQKKSVTYLNHYEQLPDHCEHLLKQMKQSQKTLKQEHMLAHSMQLSLYPLSF